MIVTAWNNGSWHESGAGYGVKVDLEDRDRHFVRNCGAVEIEIEGADTPATVNIDKDSFWNQTCRELISKEIGRWMIESGLAPWPPYNPPELKLTVIGGNRFRLER